MLGTISELLGTISELRRKLEAASADITEAQPSCKSADDIGYAPGSPGVDELEVDLSQEIMDWDRFRQNLNAALND